MHNIENQQQHSQRDNCLMLRLNKHLEVLVQLIQQQTQI